MAGGRWGGAWPGCRRRAGFLSRKREACACRCDACWVAMSNGRSGSIVVKTCVASNRGMRATMCAGSLDWSRRCFIASCRPATGRGVSPSSASCTCLALSGTWAFDKPVAYAEGRVQAQTSNSASRRKPAVHASVVRGFGDGLERIAIGTDFGCPRDRDRTRPRRPILTRMIIDCKWNSFLFGALGLSARPGKVNNFRHPRDRACARMLQSGAGTRRLHAVENQRRWMTSKSGLINVALVQA